MNFFKLYMGDYQRDTGSLSLAEHGAYMLMLQHYYATERPLPTGVALHRMLRAQDKREHAAIDTVASMFWRETPDGFVNDRAAAEITKAAIQAATNARIAHEREARRLNARKEHESFNESCANRSTNEPTCNATNRATIDQPNQSHSQRRAEEQEQEILPPKEKKGVEVGLCQSAPPLAPSVEPPEEPRSPSPPPRDAVPLHAIVALYHEKLPMLPRVEKITKARAGHIAQRWREDLPTLETWGNYFADVSASPFLTGRSPGSNGRPPFRANLEWLTKPANFAKVAEGNYHRDAA